MSASRRSVLPRFKLQFSPALIADLAARYSDDGELQMVRDIGPAARARGYFTKPEFIAACYWKTPRTRPTVALNSSANVEEATSLALAAKSEALRIMIPMALQGVSWATSSVLLHFAHRDRYPIIDYRALFSLGVPRTFNYTLPLWLGYVDVCRSLADSSGIDMRTLDRALWQWSKEQEQDS